MTNKEKEIFGKFLLEKELTDQFVLNYTKEEDENTYTDYLDRIDANLVISSAFIWMLSEEGISFWQEQDEMWHIYLAIAMEG